jgi:DNA-binding CsgD family transcriptional regulator
MDSVTPAQLRALQEIARGDGYKKAGARLGVSEQTIKNHAADAYKRIGANTAIEAFAKLGWLKVPQ